MQKRSRAGALVAGVSIALIATGCASGTGAVEKTTLENIKEKGVLDVGMSATYKPWEYMEGNNIVGFDPDLIAHFADALDVEVNMIDTDWTGVIPSFYANQFDVIVSAMTVSPDRASRVLFTQPYAAELDYFLTKDPNITTQDHVVGKVISAVLADQRTEVFEQWAEMGYTFPDPILLATEQDAILALDAGRADAAIIGYAAAYQYAQENPGYHIIPTWGPISYTAVAVRHGDEDLCHAINDKLIELNDSGELASLFEKWFGIPPSMDPTEGELPYEACVQQ